MRLLRQLLTESLILAVAGGIAGTALAYGALRAILTLVPPNTIPDESEIALNLPVLLFALAISAVTSVIFGLAPALHTCTRDLANPLRSGGRSVSGGVAQALLRKGLVVSAVALSIMLMVGASLMIRTVLAIGRVDLGFRPDRVLTLRVPLPDRKYPDPAAPRAVLSGSAALDRKRPWRDRGRRQHDARIRSATPGFRSRFPACPPSSRRPSCTRSARTTRRRSGSRS